MKPSRDIKQLLDIMAALRTPQTGCPWDLEQTFETIVPYTIEEAYEVADAVERSDLSDLKEELGDLLLQVVFHARMAEEADAFDFGDVVESITHKLIRRHPHVFGDAKDLPPSEVKRLWDSIKREEKAERRRAREALAGANGDEATILADVPLALPALTRAEKLTQKAATVGFDWRDAAEVTEKIREELKEVEDAIQGGSSAQIEDEIGDLLFAVVNLARHLQIHSEQALRRANQKFERRFKFIEAGLRNAGRSPHEATLEEMERLWLEAKQAEKIIKEPEVRG